MKIYFLAPEARQEGGSYLFLCVMISLGKAHQEKWKERQEMISMISTEEGNKVEERSEAAQSSDEELFLSNSHSQFIWN